MALKVTITIDLVLDWGGEVRQEIEDALDSLASVMLVQAEDGLYELGSPDCDNGESTTNEFVAHIWGAQVTTVAIEEIV